MLKNLVFTNITVKRSVNLIDDVDLNGIFDVTYEELNDNEINVILKYEAKTKDDGINIEVELYGNFCIVDQIDNKEKRYLLHVNTIAIMYPYLRSQVSIATTQPGFMPIQLPIVNAIALAKAAGFVE